MGVVGVLVVSVGVAAFAMRRQWTPAAREWLAGLFPAGESNVGDGHEPHAAHAGHAAHGSDDPDTLEVSEQGLKNIGYEPYEVMPRPFQQTITIPGMVVRRPGRSEVEVTASLTGAVTRIYVMEGETVAPGKALFDLRLTHEELVQAQGDYLRSLEDLDVVQREVERLEAISNIVGNAVLLRRYELQKLLGALRAQREALLLHGLSSSQIDQIAERAEERRRLAADPDKFSKQQAKEIKQRPILIQELTVNVPNHLTPSGDPTPRTLFQVHDLRVQLGQHVNIGATLCVLTDHSELFIEGNAFEHDAGRLNQAAKERWKISATVEAEAKQTVTDLEILYLAGEVDPDSRAMHFYVSLPNEIVRDEIVRDAKDAKGRRFIGWRFRPGQRVSLRVPVQPREMRLVVPIDAVVNDGVEWYVFVKFGKRIKRRAVHVEEQAQQVAVIADDGSIPHGTVIAGAGGYQLQLAMKNKAGGGVDLHAGHSH